MAVEVPSLNRVVVFAAAAVYWAGVWVQARRVRRRIGRSPNVRPRGLKEKLLWAGWSLVVVAWLTLPFLSGMSRGLPGSAIIAPLVHPLGSALGLILLGAGYAGTLWCYLALGNAWRMGINRKEPTRLVTNGPYRFVRHPIYACQLLMVTAVALLLPSFLSGAILALHLVCVLIKAADEEAHLRTLLGHDYEVYCGSTGRWLPRWGTARSAARSLPSHSEAGKPTEETLE
jgi:protein-S-isoprenylcysteine O-methyltransferase Ste14